MTRQGALDLIVATLLRPTDAGETVLALRPSREAVWTGLALVTVLGALAAAIAQVGMAEIPMGGRAIVLSPITYAVILGGSLVLTALALSWAGRMLGGEGHFDEALTLIVWLEVVALTVRVIGDLIFLISPGLAGIALLVGLLALLWALINFIRVLHRFAGLGRAMLTLIVAMLGLGIGLSILMALVGIQPGV